MIRCAYLLTLCFFVVGCRREPAADLTAADFHDQYKDWRKANERYVGQSIAIRGGILDISDSFLTPYGWKSVALGRPGAGVICHFPPTAVGELERLVPGESVVVRGVCKGEFGGMPILSECIVVPYEGPYGIQIWVAFLALAFGLFGLIVFARRVMRRTRS